MNVFAVHRAITITLRLYKKAKLQAFNEGLKVKNGVKLTLLEFNSADDYAMIKEGKKYKVFIIVLNLLGALTCWLILIANS